MKQSDCFGKSVLLFILKGERIACSQKKPLKKLSNGDAMPLRPVTNSIGVGWSGIANWTLMMPT
jgi:hypothetical protein